jgi:hypothetical protein
MIDEDDDYRDLSDEELIEQCNESRSFFYTQEYADTLMERTRAAVCFLNSNNGQGRNGRASIFAYLSLFHPEMSDQEKRSLANDIDRRGA